MNNYLLEYFLQEKRKSIINEKSSDDSKVIKQLRKDLQNPVIRRGNRKMALGFAFAATSYGSVKILQMAKRNKYAKSCYQTSRGDKDKFIQCMRKSNWFAPDTKDSTIEKYYYKAKASKK